MSGSRTRQTAAAYHLVDIMSVRRMIGFKSGTVILIKDWKGNAPSIIAASYTENSIFCSPER